MSAADHASGHQRPFDAEALRRVHFVAIGGTGMGSVAGLVKARGIEVTGSDKKLYPPMSTALADWGITPHEGFDPAHLEAGESGLAPDLVVIGNAVRADNPEAVAAIEARADLDYRTKDIQVRYVQDREQRKLDAAKAGIENRKQEEIEEARAATQRKLKVEQARITALAVSLPPLPALLIALFVGVRKGVREREGIQSARRRS